MTKGTKRYSLLWLFVLLCVVVMAVLTRKSFYGATTFKELSKNGNMDEYKIQIFEDDGDQRIFSDINDFEDLKLNSNFIAKIRVTEDRMLFSHSVYTKALVETVYKSKQDDKENEIIYIYEPVDFDEDFEIFNSTNGYQLMKSGEVYYVFLNELQTVEGYHKSSDEMRTYTPSSTAFSVYPIQKGKTEVLDFDRLYRSSIGYTYKEIKEMDILTSDESKIEQYYKLRDKVICEFEGSGT